MTIEKPYFMSDSSWFFFDEDEWIYKLTENAPEEAKKSYREFYEKLGRMYSDDPMEGKQK